MIGEISKDLVLTGGLALGAGLASLAHSFGAQQRRLSYLSHLNTLAQERHTVADYMHQWVRAIGEGRGRKELLADLIHACQEATGATAGCVFERQEDNTLVTSVTTGLFPPLRALRNYPCRAEMIDHLLKRESYRLGDGLVGTVAQSLEPILIENATGDARVFHHTDSSLSLRSLILVPIAFQRNVIGVLALANPRSGERFGAEDLGLARSLAEQAALGVHNSDLMRSRLLQSRFDFDLSVASSIQTMLLPASFPENSILDIDARYHPAQKVGGDLYDVFELPEGLVGVTIADVSGKGIPASLLMAICQSHMRHLARKHHSPAKVLCELNRILEPEIRQDMFVTLTYALIDTESHEVILARAGHELPLLITKNKCDFLMSEGIAIGMAPQNLFESTLTETRFRFNEGDRLVFYTDGLTEAINTIGEEFSSRRVAELAQQSPASTSRELNTRILKSVENFTGRRQQDDDVTLLSIRHL